MIAYGRCCCSLLLLMSLWLGIVGIENPLFIAAQRNISLMLLLDALTAYIDRIRDRVNHRVITFQFISHSYLMRSGLTANLGVVIVDLISQVVYRALNYSVLQMNSAGRAVPDSIAIPSVFISPEHAPHMNASFCYTDAAHSSPVD